MNAIAFTQACEKIIGMERIKNGIGTLSEKTLHAVLKLYFEPDEARHEIPMGCFVADIAREDGIIEIQTRSFDKLRKKLEAFLAVSPITVVYPVPHTKWLLWMNPDTGEITRKRKSPKTGVPQEIFHELYKIKPLLTHPNLNLCIVLIDMEEIRYLNGWSKDKKKGSSRCDRIPVALHDEIYMTGPSDYQKLMPETLAEQFTAKDFQKAVGLSLNRAQTGLNVLYAVGAVRRVGKQGNAYLYEKNV